MRERPSADLKEVLSEHFFGHPYDPNSIHEERFRIDRLIEVLEGWELGDYSDEELVRHFRVLGPKDFDVMLWMQSKADEGVYRPLTFDPDW